MNPSATTSPAPTLYNTDLRGAAWLQRKKRMLVEGIPMEQLKTNEIELNKIFVFLDNKKLRIAKYKKDEKYKDIGPPLIWKSATLSVKFENGEQHMTCRDYLRLHGVHLTRQHDEKEISMDMFTLDNSYKAVLDVKEAVSLQFEDVYGTLSPELKKNMQAIKDYNQKKRKELASVVQSVPPTVTTFSFSSNAAMAQQKPFVPDNLDLNAEYDHTEPPPAKKQKIAGEFNKDALFASIPQLAEPYKHYTITKTQLQQKKDLISQLEAQITEAKNEVKLLEEKRDHQFEQLTKAMIEIMK